MEWDILGILESGNRTMAWLGAVALAAGGTALVVAAYIQIQRLHSSGRGLMHGRIAKLGTAHPRKATARTADNSLPPTKPAPATTPAAGVSAYLAEQEKGSHPARPAADESVGMDALDAVLRRLRKAAESLEELALRSGKAAGDGSPYESMASGLDVEFLHRQS